MLTRFRKLRPFLTLRPVAGYIGWLGHDNLGDEILFEATSALFCNIRIVPYLITSWRTQLVENLVRRGRLYDLVILGGGTLLNEPCHQRVLRQAADSYRPFIIYGSGVRDPRFWRDYLMTRGEPARHCLDNIVPLLKEALFIGVRGPDSARILADIGIAAEVIGDPALSACIPRAPGYNCTGRIGVNVGCDGKLWGNQSDLNIAVANLLRVLTRQGWEIEFIPMSPTDLTPIRSVVKQASLDKSLIWDKFTDAKATIAHMKSFDLVIAQRLHAAILAIGSAVPAISIEYRPKCRDFMRSMAWERYCIRSDQIAPDQVEELIRDILLNYEDRCSDLRNTGDSWRDKQRSTAVELTALL